MRRRSGGQDQPEPESGPTLRLPSFGAVARHALPPLVESTVGPGALFYLVLVTDGFKGALIAALAWSYLAIIRRVVKRERISGMLALGVLLVTMRTAVAFATGSAVAYFIQPTAGTLLVAVIFLTTAVAGRPLVERMAHDFCPLDPEFFAHPFLRRFFLRVSFLWAVVLTVNAASVLWLLFSSPLRDFVLERTIVSTVLTVGGVFLSVLWFVRVMREHGISVRFSGPLDPVAVPAMAGVSGPEAALSTSAR